MNTLNLFGTIFKSEFGKGINMCIPKYEYQEKTTPD